MFHYRRLFPYSVFFFFLREGIKKIILTFQQSVSPEDRLFLFFPVKLHVGLAYMFCSDNLQNFDSWMCNGLILYWTGQRQKDQVLVIVGVAILKTMGKD